jgi:hypothetical protein
MRESVRRLAAGAAPAASSRISSGDLLGASISSALPATAVVAGEKAAGGVEGLAALIGSISDEISFGDTDMHRKLKILKKSLEEFDYRQALVTAQMDYLKANKMKTIGSLTFAVVGIAGSVALIIWSNAVISNELQGT